MPRLTWGKQNTACWPARMKSQREGTSFFFSSRRRHTRCLSDWSSDVCSSDLTGPFARNPPVTANIERLARLRRVALPVGHLFEKAHADEAEGVNLRVGTSGDHHEIGRASCRERVEAWAAARTCKKDKQVGCYH